MPLIYKQILSIIFALFATIAIEVVVIVLLKKQSKKMILTAIIINFMTNLTMNILLTYVFTNNYLYYLMLFELVVFVIEALAYYIIMKNIKDAATVSLACNAASFGIVIALNWLFNQSIFFGVIYWLFVMVTTFIGIFLNPTITYGEITNIQFFTTSYVEVTGEYQQDYAIEEYFYTHPLTFDEPKHLNSPAPSYTYYTIEAQDGDSFIVRLTITLSDENYSFDEIEINDEMYREEDLYAVTQEGSLIYVDILYENLSVGTSGYDLYSPAYAVVVVDEDHTTERAYLEITDRRDARGFCFFFGEMDDLMTHEAYIL